MRLKFLALLGLAAALCAASLGGGQTAKGGIDSSCINPPVNTVAPSVSASSNNQTTVGTANSGTWSWDGVCSKQFTFYWYRETTPTGTSTSNLARIQTVNTDGSARTDTYTAGASDKGYYLRPYVTAIEGGCCQASAWSSNAWGPILGRKFTYEIYLDNVSRGTFEVKFPHHVIGMVESQPRNGVCQQFNQWFGSFVTQGGAYSGMTLFSTAMNGGENGNGSPYPGASIPYQTPGTWNSYQPTAGLSCPDSKSPGIGAEEPFTTSPPTVIAGQQQLVSVAYKQPPGNDELLLTPYWVAGNQVGQSGECSSPGLGSATSCDWIEMGFIVGNVTECGVNLNDGKIRFYVETLHDRTRLLGGRPGCADRHRRP